MLKDMNFPIIIKNINEPKEVYKLINISYSYNNQNYCYLITPCDDFNSVIYNITEFDLVKNFKALNEDKTLSSIKTFNGYNNIFKDMSESDIIDFFSYYEK